MLNAGENIMLYSNESDGTTLCCHIDIIVVIFNRNLRGGESAHRA